MTEEEHSMMKRVHDWLFESPVEGGETRAKQLDTLLSAVRAGKLGGRVTLWIAGFVAAVLAAYAQVKGLWK